MAKIQTISTITKSMEHIAFSILQAFEFFTYDLHVFSKMNMKVIYFKRDEDGRNLHCLKLLSINPKTFLMEDVCSFVLYKDATESCWRTQFNGDPEMIALFPEPALQYFNSDNCNIVSNFDLETSVQLQKLQEEFEKLARDTKAVIDKVKHIPQHSTNLDQDVIKGDMGYVFDLRQAVRVDKERAEKYLKFNFQLLFSNPSNKHPLLVIEEAKGAIFKLSEVFEELNTDLHLGIKSGYISEPEEQTS